MNLLTDNWIPVQKQGIFEHISLKRLLCKDDDWQLSLSRDDMELAALQLIVCLVQVVFMPEDEDDLLYAWEKPMAEGEYEKGAKHYMECFDLLHEKYPFMQYADVKPQLKQKNWSSLQKLFVGLPEVSSNSPTSNAFFNTVNEIKTVSQSEAAIALFQQATNGFGLGGRFFSVGLKGSMSLTTLIIDQNLRESIWVNILSRKFISNIAPQMLKAKNSDPVWINSPHKSYSDEKSHDIGLARGLFWQPAKVKLEISGDQLVTGFYKETGLCKIKGFWLHPHTPFDLSKLNSTNAKDKPYLSARNDLPLWGQMLSFFYSQKEISPTEREGVSSALVVQQFRKVWLGTPLNLAVGGYVKGKTAENLAGRRHEIFNLSSGWEDQASEMKGLVKFGVKAFEVLDDALSLFGFLAIEHEKKRRKEATFKKGLRKKGKSIYFKNSEPVMHSILREIKLSDREYYKKEFANLARGVFEQVLHPFEHDPKLLKAIVRSRVGLNKNLKEI